MKYTLQKDFGKYGARWGCYATSILNIAENETGKKFTEFERFALVGKWFDSQSIFLANYHNHKSPLDRGSHWDTNNDPEWHFLVGHINNALNDCFYIKGKKATTKKANYYLCEFNVFDGHWCLMIDNQIINPDPTIEIKITDLIKKIPIAA